jgi:hypothetical protein
MSLLTDTAWPAYLLELFDECYSEPRPNERYSTPYNMLFIYCVAGPEPVPFMFSPPFPPIGSSGFNSNDFRLSLIVQDVSIPPPPVLLVDIKDESRAHSARSRLEADHHMRQLFDSFHAECPLPRLYGLSLLGTSLRVYVRDATTGEIKPAKGPIAGSLPHDFLEGAWDVDVLSQRGFDVMKEIVGEIVTNILLLRQEESVGFVCP